MEWNMSFIAQVQKYSFQDEELTEVRNDQNLLLKYKQFFNK